MTQKPSTGARTLMLAGGLTAILLPTVAEAVPAWARKYDMDCAACHFGATNKLTQMGREFMLRGFKMPGEEGIDDPMEVKLAHYVSARVRYQFTADKDAQPSTAFNTAGFSFYAGGPLYDEFSFFTNYSPSSTSTISEGYLKFVHDIGDDNHLGIRAGRIAPYVAQSNVFTGRPRILFNNVGGGNTWTPNTKSDGASVVLGTKSKTYVEAGIVNGGSAAEANNFKDVYGSVEQMFDGGSSVSAYYYQGRAPIGGNNPWEMGFNRIGLNGQVVGDNWLVEGGWMRGRNDLQAGGTRSPEGYYVGTAFNFNPNVTLLLSWESLDTKLNNGKTEAYSIGAALRLRQLGRATATVTNTNPQGSSARTVLNLGLDWSF